MTYELTHRKSRWSWLLQGKTRIEPNFSFATQREALNDLREFLHDCGYEMEV